MEGIITHTCMLCLDKNHNLNDVFERSLKYRFSVAELISELLPFQLSKDRKYPHKVCDECLRKMIDYKGFRDKCVRSWKFIENFISSTYVGKKIQTNEEQEITGLETRDDSYLLGDKTLFIDTAQDLEEREETEVSRENSGGADGSYEADVTGKFGGLPVIKTFHLSETNKIEVHPLGEHSRKRHFLKEQCIYETSVKSDNEAILRNSKILHQCNRPPRSDLIEKVTEKLVNEFKWTGDSYSGQYLPRTKRNNCGNRLYSCNTCIGCSETSSKSQDTSLNSQVMNDTGIKSDDTYSGVMEIKEETFVTNAFSKNYPCGKLYNCSKCNKKFTNETNFVVHIRSHTKERPFVCSDCNKTFTTKGNLLVHKRRHTNERPFGCEVCGICFTTKGNLMVHNRRHTNEKPFDCEFCGKCFITKGNLLVHMRRHTNERPFGCEICGKCFITKGNLKVHFRNHLVE